MIKYTEIEALRLFSCIINPILRPLAQGPWSLIVFPENNTGKAPVYKGLTEWKEERKEGTLQSWSITPTYSWNTDGAESIYRLFRCNIIEWTQDNKDIKVCALTDGDLRIRFAENLNNKQREDAVNRLVQQIKDNVSYSDLRRITTVKECNTIKGEKKMNSFSLTNLKDALINKITHFDKKTVTILALIALVLLVVGKYQYIKDILLGIKDKVKRSKNFKAMIADGTAALDSLKKIVGVKDNKETTDEA